MKYTLPKLNLILMAVCFGITIIGFALMAGAPSGAKYNPDIFSVRRLHIGPMVAFLGFIGIAVSILIKPKKQDKEEATKEEITRIETPKAEKNFTYKPKKRK